MEDSAGIFTADCNKILDGDLLDCTCFFGGEGNHGTVTATFAEGFRGKIRGICFDKDAFHREHRKCFEGLSDVGISDNTGEAEIQIRNFE